MMAGKPGRGSERVKAWIYAVLNPWEDILAFELGLLNEWGVSFRWRRRELEYIRHLRASLGRGAELNLDDLIRMRPEVRDWETKHDNAVDRVRQAARDAFAELTSLQDFRDAVTNARGATPELARQVTEDDEHLIALSAERVLNKVHALSRDYSDAEFWDTHRDKLLAYRTGPKIVDLDLCRDALIEIDEELSRNVSMLRDALVEEYDVPAAPAVVG